MVKRQPKDDGGRPIEYDPDFHGPLKNRSCTDVLCLLLFLVFIAAWVAVGFWAIKHGDPETLLIPRDSQGFRCGLDEAVKDRPYLFFFDLTECFSASTPFTGCSTTQVCVSKCPNTTFIYSSSGDNLVATPYCEYDTVSYAVDKCPQWFLPSESVEQRCIPSLGLINNNTLQLIMNAVFSQGTLNKVKLNTAIGLTKVFLHFQKVVGKIIADIITAQWQILIGAAFVLLSCIIFILIMRWIAGVMVIISIVGAVAAFSAGTYFSYAGWQSWKSEYDTNGGSSNKTMKELLLAIFIIVAIALGIIVLVLIFLRKQISLAIAVIKEAGKAVNSVTSVLFFPIFPWLLQAGVIVYGICVAIYLYTMGEPLYQYRNLTEDCRKESGWTVDTQCFTGNFSTDSYPSCRGAICRFAGIANEAYYPYLQTVNIFTFFWSICFVSALGQMVLAQVFAQWYWTMKKRSLPFFALTAAFYRTIRYHLGTIAFGSLIIAICKMIRVGLEYLDKKLKKYDNQFIRAIMCCLKCFFWCLEKFLVFINKNAYIMCAIHGKNFCSSAKDAFMLLMRNVIRVFVINKVTDFLFFLSKVLITACDGAVAYLFFCTDYISFMDNSDLNYGLTPVVILMIITWFVATLFFSVYSMAVDTLFLCFLEDCERNDGKSKPYYMSRNLMKIFGKRNKEIKYD